MVTYVHILIFFRKYRINRVQMTYLRTHRSTIIMMINANDFQTREYILAVAK